MQTRMSLEQLVANSALVVVGTLDAITPGGGAGILTPDLGRLRVEELLFVRDKTAAPVKEVALLLPGKGGAIASDSVFHTLGQRGIWFLRASPGADQRYLADHSQRLQPMSALDDVRRAVKGASR